jgi:Holliday junction resolvasome RuvABC ATP-dependent DNA helicase subunit
MNEEQALKEIAETARISAEASPIIKRIVDAAQVGEQITLTGDETKAMVQYFAIIRDVMKNMLLDLIS